MGPQQQGLSGRRRLGPSHTGAGNTNSPARLLGLWSAQGADLASRKNELGKGSRESGSQPSSLEFRAGSVPAGKCGAGQENWAEGQL